MSVSLKKNQTSSFAAHALRVDVTDEESVQQLVEGAKSLFGRIDYFVNTAGVSGYRRLESTILNFEGLLSQSSLTL